MTFLSGKGELGQELKVGLEILVLEKEREVENEKELLVFFLGEFSNSFDAVNGEKREEWSDREREENASEGVEGITEEL